MQSGRERQGRVGGVVMVQCIDFSFLNTIMLYLRSVLSCNMRRKWIFLDTRPQ